MSPYTVAASSVAVGADGAFDGTRVFLNDFDAAADQFGLASVKSSMSRPKSCSAACTTGIAGAPPVLPAAGLATGGVAGVGGIRTAASVFAPTSAERWATRCLCDPSLTVASVERGRFRGVGVDDAIVRSWFAGDFGCELGSSSSSSGAPVVFRGLLAWVDPGSALP